ncbi:hypothetical protein B0H34DRAFT_728691 [Crassisporium funariophilum]|nr:hypothetical protein B0H34DRAFT_728691 [Crassisporium funariophilum]
MFSKVHNLVITGGSFVEHHPGDFGKTGLQLLYQNTVHGASYDSTERFPPPKCHPETRKAIIREIMAWISNVDRTEDILWVNGPAGTGKSAIAQTIAELCEAANQLAGSFFFSRAVAGRDHAGKLFMTIAYQLSIAIPEVGQIVEDIIKRDPSILDKSPDVQLRKLVVEPVESLGLETLPVVIIIDGLDECAGEDMQCYILQQIASLCQQGNFPICFLIASRPEPWIRDEFSSEPLIQNFHQICLEQTYEVDNDIRTFFRSGFSAIHASPKYRYTMSHIPTPWPADDIVNDLVAKASGQFIYASTVLKFVGDPQYRPVDQLQAILEIPARNKSSSNAFADLDCLYLQILASCTNNPRTHLVLGTVPLAILEKLVNLEHGEAYLALRTIHSLVYLHDPSSSIIGPATTYPTPAENLEDAAVDSGALIVRFYHKSFIDFLLDASRSGIYYLDTPAIHTRLALSCLNVLTEQLLHTPQEVDYLVWGYALVHWVHHCTNSVPTQGLLHALEDFDLYSAYILTIDAHRPRLALTQKMLIKPETLVQRLRRLMLIGSQPDSKTYPTRSRASFLDIEIAKGYLVKRLSYYARASEKHPKFLFSAPTCSKHIRALADWLKTLPNPPQILIGQYEAVWQFLDI